jgi:hypothetical protein
VIPAATIFGDGRNSAAVDAVISSRKRIKRFIVFLQYLDRIAVCSWTVLTARVSRKARANMERVTALKSGRSIRNCNLHNAAMSAQNRYFQQLN